MGEVLRVEQFEHRQVCPECGGDMSIVTVAGQVELGIDFIGEDIETKGLSEEELEDIAEEYLVCLDGCGYFTTDWGHFSDFARDSWQLKVRRRRVHPKLEKIRVKLRLRLLPPDVFPKGYLHFYTHLLLAEVMASDR